MISNSGENNSSIFLEFDRGVDSNVKAIEARDLTKYYGNFLAVDHISFDVEQGEIFGFLGPNGAGKSTTIRMLTGISTPTEGTATVMGFDIIKHPVEAKSVMGIVPDISNVYTELTAWENLIFTGKLYGISKDSREKKAEELLKLFDLFDRRDEEVEGFSRGMRRRVCIAMALVNDSKVLYLDEPTSGLDVKSVRNIRGLVRELNEDGLTVFLTTHDMHEADKLSDRVAFINQGKIAAIDTPLNLKRAYGERALNVEILNKDGILRKEKLILDREKSGEEVKRMIEKENVVTMHSAEATLEDIFIQITGRGLS